MKYDRIKKIIVICWMAAVVSAAWLGSPPFRTMQAVLIIGLVFMMIIELPEHLYYKRYKQVFYEVLTFMLCLAFAIGTAYILESSWQKTQDRLEHDVEARSTTCPTVLCNLR
jgi:energy-coupling factor transporter transmembrane protein EcfT